jgi:hypothetical protein
MLQNDSSTLFAPCSNANVPQVCFSELLGARVLALLDVENLSYTLAPHYDVDYGRLRQDLVASADEVHGHAIATVPEDDDAVGHAYQCFRTHGWTSHLTRQVTAGRYRRTNADPQLLLHAGQLIERKRPDIVVLGSADGELGYELALFVQQLSPRVRFMTLSAPGALAGLLLTARNRMVDANLLLHPQHIAHLAPMLPEFDSTVRSFQ